MSDLYNAIEALPSVMTERLLPIDYELYVPTSYWEKGAQIVPEIARPRVNQMELFYKLYKGDYRDFVRATEIRSNYHKLTTSFVHALMLMFPPEITLNGQEDLPVSGRFVQQLIRALKLVISDMVRFGTGLLRVYPGRWGSEVRAHMPVYWYPTDEMSDTLAVSSQGYVELWHDTEEGNVTYELWRVPDFPVGQNADRKGTQLGDLETREVEQYGDEAQWDIIQSLTLGRPGLIIPIASDVPAGDWGESIYPELSTLAFEVTHRLTQNKGTLDDHGNPILALEPGEIGRQMQGVLTQEDIALGEDGAGQDFGIKLAADHLNRWRSRRVTGWPAGYIGGDYLQWTGNLNDHFAQILKCEELLFAATRLPAAFFNIGPGGLPPSGVAMIKQFIRTEAYIRALIAEIRPAITRAVLVGSMLNGSPPDELQAIYDGLEITWDTVFDLPQTQTVEEDPAPEVDAEVDEGGEEPEEPEAEEE